MPRPGEHRRAGASWSSSSARNVAGPPAMCTTPGGTPLGSTPTEHTVAAATSGVSINASLPGMSPSGAELVAADQGQLGVDPQLPEFCEQRVGGIGLVGQPDLDVLGVARDLRVFETFGDCDLARELRDCDQAVDSGVAQPVLDGDEQLVDRGFRRVLPLGQGDEIDLSSVESLRDDLGLEPVRAQSGHDLLGGARRTRRPRRVSPRAVRRCADRRRPTSKSSEPRLSARNNRPGPDGRASQLPVDVADMGAAHDRDVHSGSAQGFDDFANRARVGLAVGDGGAVPIEDQCVEAPRERRGKCGHGRRRVPGQAARCYDRDARRDTT